VRFETIVGIGAILRDDREMSNCKIRYFHMNTSNHGDVT
jgi:hypothetical protein